MSQNNMEDIAKLAGLSSATISRVLHSPHLVKPATRDRVMRLMQEQGYIYNATAGDFSRQKSTVIGLVTPIAQHVAFGYATLAILEKAQEEGLSIIMGNTGFKPEAEKAILRQFLSRRVAGVIMMGYSIGQEETIRELVKNGIPCIVVWETLDDPDISFVGFDNREAAMMVTEYLISLGHRRIGLIVSLFHTVGRIRKRFEGFKDALEQHNIPFDPELVFEREPTLFEGKEAMSRMLSLPNPPEAVFAASDYLALGALTAAKQRGLRVPEDISIAGFDDIEFSAYSDPPLTTLRSPAYEMGQMAVKFMAEMVRGKAEVRQYRFEPELVIRKSCAAPRSLRAPSGEESVL